MATTRPPIPHHSHDNQHTKQGLPEINTLGDAYVELAKLSWECLNLLLLRMLYFTVRGIWELLKPKDSR